MTANPQKLKEVVDGNPILQSMLRENARKFLADPDKLDQLQHTVRQNLGYTGTGAGTSGEGAGADERTGNNGGS